MQPSQLWKKRALTATKAGPVVRRITAVGSALAALALLDRLLPIRLSRFVVFGSSMEPALQHGDRLLVLRGPATLLRPQPGQIVVARPAHIPNREMVKRVGAVLPRGARTLYVLLGDNSAGSTDSRHFGPVPAEAVTGRVLLRYWPEHRAGAIRPVYPSGSATPASSTRTRRSRTRP